MELQISYRNRIDRIGIFRLESFIRCLFFYLHLQSRVSKFISPFKTWNSKFAFQRAANTLFAALPGLFKKKDGGGGGRWRWEVAGVRPGPPPDS